MRIKRYYIILILLLSCVSIAHPQKRQTEIDIDFRVNRSVIEPTFGKNEAHLEEIIGFINIINSDPTLSILELTFCGTASPEGSSQLNRRLASNRLKALEKYVRSRVDIPDSLITYDDSYIPWDRFRKLVEGMDMDIGKKQEVLSIIDKDSYYVDYHGNSHIDGRVVELMRLDGGIVWKQLFSLFHDLRGAYAVFTTVKTPPDIPIMDLKADVTLQLDTVHPHVFPVADTREHGYRHLHVSTNLPAWGLLISNATVEFDLAKHWTFALPVYYSALNYFRDNVKYRTFTLQPELRYWLKGCESSFYAGLHFGMSYYNVAFGDLFRYQDHLMKTPSLGGGLSIGYRLPLGKSQHWRLDFAVGAGIYNVHYDRFVNVPNGILLDSHRMVYKGIDHADISLSYMFNLAKRKK